MGATGTGGNGLYYYYWQPTGISTNTLGGLTAGTYTVLIADSSGCLIDTTIAITEPSPITIVSNTIAATCSSSNGSATITPSGGGGVYTYIWNPTGTNNSTLSNALPNTYTVSVLDNYNCLRNFPIIIPSRLSTASPSFSVNTAYPNSLSLFSDLSINGNDSIVSWSWDFNDPLSGGNNFSLQQNPQHIFTPGGTYSPTLSVQTKLGCAMSFSLGVPFYPMPVAAFNSHSICANSSISFTNTSTINPGSITKYDWIFGDPGSGLNNTSSIVNPVHFYSNSGVYTITLTTTSNNNCLASVTHSINVAPLPVASFTASNVCVNSSSQFTNLAGGSFVKWYWDFGDNSPKDSLVISPTHTFVKAGTYSVILTTVSSQNCFNSDTLNVSVFPKPIINFNAPGVCINKPTTFTDLTSVSSGSISSWSWDFGDFSPLNTAQNPVHTFGAYGIFNVNLSVMGSNNCPATLTKTVGVYPNPKVDFSITSGCLNIPTNFTDKTNPGNGATTQTWIWAFGDGSPIATIQNPTHTYITAGTYSATLVATNKFGCKDTTRKAITVFPNPVISFNVDDTSGCEEVCTNFKGVGFPSGLVSNWVWNFGDGSVNDTTANPFHCYKKVGSYTVTLTGSTANGCIGVSTQTSVVNIHPIPVASFSYSPPNPTTSNPEIYYQNTSQNIVSFVWQFSDFTTNTINNSPIHASENAGEYCTYLKVYNQFGCSDIVKHCFFVEKDFTFYVPNAFTPNTTKGVNDFFTGYGTNIDDFKMWIYDRWGEQIYYTNDITLGWDGKAKEGRNIAKQDVYTYKIEVTDFRGDLHKYIGHVTLLR